MAKPRGQIPPPFAHLDFSLMPRHVAIIMDGNGRWALDRGKLRAAGHRAGMERLVHVVETSSDIGLEALTLYAFSTENWKRPRHEIEVLFSLLVEFLRRHIRNLHKNNVRLRMLGQWQTLPETVVSEIRLGCELTKENDGLVLCIGLNYGGRDEIVRAAKALATDIAEKRIGIDAIDEAKFSDALYTGGLPDPDIIIRTGGEQRLSNFLLYQSAYSELVSVKEYWPDFTDEVYAQCLRDYISRERRFGDIGGGPS